MTDRRNIFLFREGLTDAKFLSVSSFKKLFALIFYSALFYFPKIAFKSSSGVLIGAI